MKNASTTYLTVLSGLPELLLPDLSLGKILKLAPGYLSFGVYYLLN